MAGVGRIYRSPLWRRLDPPPPYSLLYVSSSGSGIGRFLFFWFASGPFSSWSFCYLSSLQHQGRDVPLLTSSDAQAAKVRLRVWLWVRVRVRLKTKVWGRLGGEVGGA